MRRKTMRRIKEVLRHWHDCKVSQQGISKICQISRSTVGDYINRFTKSGLSWPLPAGVTDDDLERALFVQSEGNRKYKDELNYAYLLMELKKPNMTKEVLWDEYKQSNAQGYNYSHFCTLIRQHQRNLQYSMRQEHKAGEKGFLDFGEGLKLLNPETGELVTTQLYVFVWGASNYTWARAILNQELPSWIDVNTRALEHFGCCPKVEVPDNLKAAVSKACRYEPDLNPTYADFAKHYGMVIMPARPYKPKDKAKVENGVKLAKRWILARLRNQIFTSLFEMNKAIGELLVVFNDRPLRKINKSRKELFELLDRPHALPLPLNRYEYAEWKHAKVNVNYHVNYDRHDYSVPYTLIGKSIEIRATQSVVEIYKNSQRICAHQRSERAYGYTTVADHMPPSHQKYLEWTPQRILEWAEKYGDAVKRLVEKIMASRSHPEQAFKSCLGIIRLEKNYSALRLNAACQRALDYRAYSYRAITNILSKNLDQHVSESDPKKTLTHENIRGADYYANELTLFANPN